MLTVNRDTAQVASAICFISGGISFYFDSPLGWVGWMFIATSLWIMLMSESLLLAKVQNEMQSALDKLNKRRENEIEDLLYFLRDMRQNMTPFESVESTIRMIKGTVRHPAIIVDSSSLVVSVNDAWTEIFGWTEDELSGKVSHKLHDPSLYADYAMGCGKKYDDGKNWIWSRMIFMHKNGSKIKASVGVIFLGTKKKPMGALGLILPDSGGIIEEI